jgi:protoheme IX farnesyltransferase
MVSLAALLGTALASASAAVFNQILEVQIDTDMERTQGRSIPSGKVGVVQACSFGIALGVAALTILYFRATPLAALIAFCGQAFYIFIYTLLLKRRTTQNIVIGGAAGAVGPLIGWAAITGDLSWQAWMLFLIITLWTPPHFWALALKYSADYARAGIPMYPVVYGGHKTRRAIFLYSATLLPPILFLYAFNAAGLIYLAISLPLTHKIVFDALQLYRSQNNSSAMRLFHYSCLYTFGVFGALTFDRLMFFL